MLNLGKRKRNRDPLAVNSVDSRYSAVSVPNSCYLNARCRLESTDRSTRRCSNRRSESTSSYWAARNAPAVSIDRILIDADDSIEPLAALAFIEPVPYPIAPPPVRLTPVEELIEATHSNKVSLSPGSAELRRSTIAYFFVEIYGCPSEDTWPLVVTDLIKRLRMPVGSRDAVYSIFKDIVHCRLDKTKFSPNVKSGRGRKNLIQQGSVEEKLILVAMEQSLSVTEATAIVNLARSAQSLPRKPRKKSRIHNQRLEMISSLKKILVSTFNLRMMMNYLRMVRTNRCMRWALWIFFNF